MSYDPLDLAILKTITSNKNYGLDFANNCETKIFSPEVWNFANLVVGYLKTHHEVPTLRVLTEKLSKGNNRSLSKCVQDIWTAMDTITYDEREYKHDLIKLKNRYAEQELSRLATKLSKAKETDDKLNVKDCLSDIQKTVFNVRSLDALKTYERKTLKEALPAFVERFNAKRNNPSFETGLKTGYAFLDYSTNGFKPADFILIAGESGFGKSMFLNNIAVQVWMQQNTLDSTEFSAGKNIIYFSLEMPFEDCFNRLISRLSGVPSRRIENATTTKEQFLKIKAALDFIDRYPYQFRIVDIANASANDLEAILADNTDDLDAIFIDYLGIMQPNESKEEQDWLKQGIIAYETRSIGRKYSLPIFSAVQLNRKSPNKDSSENIGLGRLARSNTIATHATTVVQIENRVNEEQYPDFLYHVIKSRKGIKGKGKLIKNFACATLIETEPNKNFEEEINNQFIDIDDITEEAEELEL
jgi:replicative DNA helicase